MVDTRTSGPAPPPFAAAPALAAYLAPPAAYLATQGPDGAADKLVVGTAVVIGRPAGAPPPRLLLVRRSRHDFGGGCWETPGGLCEPGRDGSVLAAAARELREEAGLAVRRFAGRVATPHAWVEARGAPTRWRKLTFLVVEADGDEAAADREEGAGKEERRKKELPVVRLDPDEHDDYVWASEREVCEGRAGERVFTWISEDQRTVVLDAFALARRLEEEEKGEAPGAEGDGKDHVNTDTLS